MKIYIYIYCVTQIVCIGCKHILVMRVDFVHAGSDRGRHSNWKLNFGDIVDIIGQSWLGSS